eukprot:CAMPEP_0198313244 /NCGR_PEP_ID=MMETSP1450-20131203/4317_1 /TAXON_ID=753684 ORGANISM="Madagascaria erythrocladiodes, Strain CCMP3234" /NCGR_SAMPLE_ID=MMETSP1450 /ASSEMBLY_ACC=CAM_ASM_001115 /LENGTH=215 /DNA_ID=CAMNT_0044016229 /DNA_START=49 /DNA_END=692 /DNA_ORIENTATION=-
MTLLALLALALALGASAYDCDRFELCVRKRHCRNSWAVEERGDCEGSYGCCVEHLVVPGYTIDATRNAPGSSGSSSSSSSSSSGRSSSSSSSSSSSRDCDRYELCVPRRHCLKSWARTNRNDCDGDFTCCTEAQVNPGVKYEFTRDAPSGGDDGWYRAEQGGGNVASGSATAQPTPVIIIVVVVVVAVCLCVGALVAVVVIAAVVARQRAGAAAA